MKLSSLLIVGLAGLSTLGFANQTETEKGPWLVRLRALNLNSANQSAPFTALGINFPSDAISLNAKVFPEVDISYFLNKNIALELVLTYPQQHDVTLAGVGKIGTVTHLPPVLSVQYHYPIPNSQVTPYVGVGVNYTRVTEARLSAGGVALDVKRDSVGLAYGFGFDYKINETWSLNFDFKRVNIDTDVKVKSSGAFLTNLDINPNLFSIGVGYRF